MYNVLCGRRKEDFQKHRKGPSIRFSFIGQLRARYRICTVSGSVRQTVSRTLNIQPLIKCVPYITQRLRFVSGTDWVGSKIASSRLASLASTVAMGGGPKPEHLLVILPFREPVEALERIKKNHPHIEITFKNLHFTDTPWKGVEDIPKGKLTRCPTMRTTVLTCALFAS